MRCRKNGMTKGIIAGVLVGTAVALAIGFAVTQMCGCSNATLKKKARKALREAKNYIDGLI